MATPLFSFSGLASGLDTNSIIQQLLAIERQPRKRLELQQARLDARKQALSAIDARADQLRDAVAALRSSATWAPVQQISTSQNTIVEATLDGAASPGGYQVEVLQLARAEQRTYDFTAPASDDTLTIGSWSTTVTAGTTIEDLAAQINADENAPVYAVVVQGRLVLSSRQTGTSGAFTANASFLSEDTGAARLAQDAQFKVDGVLYTRSSNRVSDVIAGVTLDLRAASPGTTVTVNVTPPGVDRAAVKAKVKAFVEAYNSLLDLVRDDLAETPVKNPTTTTDARKGALYADSSLRDLVGQLRQLVSDPVAGLAADRDELAEIGISTGATTGSGTINPNAVAGRLTFDEAKFDAALDADPLGVQKLVGAVAGSDGFAQRLDTTLAAWAGPGGVFDQRQTSISSEISTIQDRMAAIDRRLELREQQLRAQFTAMEEALQAVQAQGSWLQAQLAGMLRSS